MDIIRIIERAGHNPQSEQTAETVQLVRDFLAPEVEIEQAIVAGPARPAVLQAA